MTATRNTEQSRPPAANASPLPSLSPRHLRHPVTSALVAQRARGKNQHRSQRTPGEEARKALCTPTSLTNVHLKRKDRASTSSN